VGLAGLQVRPTREPSCQKSLPVPPSITQISAQCSPRAAKKQVMALKKQVTTANSRKDGSQLMWRDAASQSHMITVITWALFTSEKISDFGTVALSFVCDKYYLIMD